MNEPLPARRGQRSPARGGRFHGVRERGAGEVSWARWPRWLSSRAREVTAELRDGRPSAALDGLDALMADLAERRRTVADIANRHFEPSTDDRHS